MRLALLVMFLVVPVVELAILIQLGQSIGLLWTVALVVGTAFLGSSVLYRQGLATMLRGMESLARGVPPVGPMAEGVVLLLAGALLLTPGLLTDLVGATLLVPGIRRWIARKGFERLLGAGSMTIVEGHEVHEHRNWEVHRESGGSKPKEQEGPIIEGEYERLDERNGPRGPSKPTKQ